MGVKIDLDKCEGCGTCEEVCPEVFELGDDGKAHVVGDCKEHPDCVEEAIISCPEEAISYDEEGC